MHSYQGVIIEESLEDKVVLERVQIASTKIEKVTEEHQTPWLSHWTLHSVEVSEADAGAVAEKIQVALDREHGSSWYADFKNDTYHYIIYPGKVFCIDRKSEREYEQAKLYGISLGIPEHQVDFGPGVEKWER